MTDPADPTTLPATTDPDDGPPPSEVDADAGDDPPGAWDRHRELLALLLVVAAIGQILQALLTAYGYGKPTPGSGQGIAWGVFLPALGTGGQITTAVLVVAALVVAVGSGRRDPGRLGWLTIQAVSVVGVVSAALALLLIEEYERNRSGAADSARIGGFGGGPAFGWLEAGLGAHALSSAALAGGAAYVAWRRLQAGGSDLAEVDDADQVDQVGAPAGG
ncbi:MAG: hypothetical protein KF703_19150 [Actinobacteria bacterium]|nr:hypothetical protein [Actinomycetota bacterium]